MWQIDLQEIKHCRGYLLSFISLPHQFPSHPAIVEQIKTRARKSQWPKIGASLQAAANIQNSSSEKPTDNLHVHSPFKSVSESKPK